MSCENAAVTASATGYFTNQTASQRSNLDDLASAVNPFVGTKPGGEDHGTGGGAGNTFPGAVVPFGMMQWSPDTVKHQDGGYFYDDNRIKGFSLTHLSGAGCSTYQDIPFMPVTSEVTTSPATDPARYVSTFSHQNEAASPGRYQVKLDSGAGVDLAATQRSGIGRLTFPAGSPATLLANVTGSVSGADDAQVTIGDKRISGWVASGHFCGQKNTYRLYFNAEFDQPFAGKGTWRNGTVTPDKLSEQGGSLPAPELRRMGELERQSTDDTTVTGPGTGAYVTFAPGSTVNTRIGISFVSVDNAEENAQTEQGGKSLEDIAAAGRAAWNQRLGAIQVGGGSPEHRSTFYTALYHSLLQPNVFSDVDGRYPGFDGKIHETDPEHPIYTNVSGWDVYRSEIALQALLAPKETSDIITSLYTFAEQGGAWDRWTVANDFTGVMVGDPYHAMVASAYAMGATDFDAKKALLLMLRGATQPTQGYEERPGLVDYMKLGYVPYSANSVWGPPSSTLEYTSADFAIADLARRLGDSASYKEFSKRSQYWQNLYNPGSGYLQTRNADGSFTEPFNPASPSNYVEGNAAQYVWMVPHNVKGLVTALGGNEPVNKRLDEFFSKFNAGPKEPYCFLGNEPVMHTPWLYNWTGAPAKTQATVRRAMTELFNAKPEGLVGNDDLGQMSSWYVWAALGMYPVVPGRAELALNGPLFPEVTINRPGKAPIVVKGGSDTNRYVSGLKVNGTSSAKAWLPENFVHDGGTLEYTMTDAPTQWGAAAGDEPPSFREGEIGQQAYVQPGRLVIPAGQEGKASIGAQDLSGKGATVTWTAAPPPGFTVSPDKGSITVPPGGKQAAEVKVTVAPGTAEGSYKIPITFGGGLRPTTLTVLVAQPGSLRSVLDNTGVSSDAAPAGANFDGGGFSYSLEALGKAGVSPGKTVTVDGLSYPWTASANGEYDNVSAAGQTVLIDAPAGAGRLSLLGSGANGKASGTLTITYTDGSTQQASIGFSDWALGGKDDPPSFNNRVAAKTPYRNKSDGSQKLNVYLFTLEPIALQAGKQVKSVTLPQGGPGGQIRVFGIAVG
ncbi:glycoside hydrolase family 92 protein [Pseudonocardiaceae bacterium YIM PH 21723]|nr:glycoside hydrolase family 92 protein [Pseudonocardiaceae bacterium YIM PH 21723]